MKFIRLTEYHSGDPIYINADKIEALFREKDAEFTFINVTGIKTNYVVSESIPDILDKIEREDEE